MASPLSLLRETDTASEVLALTYSFNAAFWERAALSVARQLRARVTVVSDARMAEIDPRAVRKAGVTYLDGRAVVKGGGAFHPKLFSIASRDQAVVAVGSGNLTISGWHGNAEVWTVLRGSIHGAPAAFHQIADFLAELPAAVTFSTGVEGALERTAELLRGFPSSGPSPSIVSSIHRPVVDQLPEGPVDELCIVSPFLDPASVAVEAVIERFQPRRWEVILDRDANYDGSSLVAIAGSRGGGIATIKSDRYHHGKVIEWVTPSGRHALSGSPNASRSGLLRAAVDGGNVELGLIDEIGHSLRPDTVSETPLEHYEARQYKSDSRTEPAVLLLAGTLERGGLILALSGPLQEPARLEVAEEDIWRESLVLPAGINPLMLELTLTSGTLIRVRTGAGRYSNIVAATLLELPLRPSIRSVGRVETDELKLFDDPRVAEKFALDLAELKGLLGQTSSTPTTSDSQNQPARDLSFETWDEYLEQITARLGDSLTRYGLALPRLGSVSEWVEVKVDPDDPEDPFNDGSPSSSRTVRNMKDTPTAFRVRYRRWASRLVEVLPTLLPAAQLIAARLLLASVASGLWDSREESFELVLGTARSLGTTRARFPEEVPRIGSMAALCLTMARREISLEVTGSKELAYARAVEACRDVVGSADSEFVSAYVDDLQGLLGVEVEPARVLDVGQKLSDPFDHVVLDAEDLGFSVRREGHLYRIVGWEVDPELAAQRIMARAQKLSPVGVIYSQEDQRVFVGWDQPKLMVEGGRRSPLGGELYLLKHLEPSDLRRMSPTEVRELRVNAWSSTEGRPSEAQNLLQRIGMT